MTNGFVANQVIALTGTASGPIREDLMEVAVQNGFDLNNITLEQFREVVAIYMQETLLSAKAALTQFN